MNIEFPETFRLFQFTKLRRCGAGILRWVDNVRVVEQHEKSVKVSAEWPGKGERTCWFPKRAIEVKEKSVDVRDWFELRDYSAAWFEACSHGNAQAVD